MEGVTHPTTIVKTHLRNDQIPLRRDGVLFHYFSHIVQHCVIVKKWTRRGLSWCYCIRCILCRYVWHRVTCTSCRRTYTWSTTYFHTLRRNVYWSWWLSVTLLRVETPRCLVESPHLVMTPCGGVDITWYVLLRVMHNGMWDCNPNEECWITRPHRPCIA